MPKQKQPFSKRIFTFLLTFTLSFCLLFSGCSQPGRISTSDPTSDSTSDSGSSAGSQKTPLRDYKCCPTDLYSEYTTFSNFCDFLFRENVSSSGLDLHYTILHPENYGITNYSKKLSDITIDQIPQQNQKIQDYFTKLKSFDYASLTEEEQLTFDILYADLEDSLKLSKYYLCDESLAPQGGDNSQLPILLAEYSFHSKQDVENYLELLSSVEDYFQMLIEFENLKSEKGYFMSDETADGIINQCQDFIKNPEQNYLLSVFDERIENLTELSEDEKNNFKQKNKEYVLQKVIPAYELLIDGLKKLKGTGKNDGGLCHFTDGKEYYEQLVRSNTGSDKSISELENLCESNLKKYLISATMYSAANDMDLTKSPFSQTDPEKILNELQEKIKSDFPEGADTSFQVKHVTESLQESINPAFYLTPPIDDIKNNVIYINDHSISEASIYTTLAHEGYPGHLYQTTYFAATNPPLIRNSLNYPGYTEGWATYVEYLSYEYADKGKKKLANLSCLNSKFNLALSSLLDMRVNYDGWTLKQTQDFLASYGITNADSVSSLYSYVITQPANYLRYYIGYLEFDSLKSKAQDLLGDSFCLKDFHKFILETGPCQFDVLENYMDQWISSVSGS